MSDFFKMFGIAVASLFGILVFCFILNAFGYSQFAFWAPKYTQVQYEVYKNSQQYNDGNADELAHYQDEYNSTGESEAAKESIRSTVRHQYASYPEQNLNPDLRAFLEQMKGNG